MNNFLQLYDKSIRLKPNGFSLLQNDNGHDHVTVISNLQVPVLIPKTLFDETAKEDYINLNYEIEEPIFIFDEEIEEYHLLHFIPERQKMELEQHGYSLQWLHLSGLLYKELRQSEFYDSRKSYFSLYAEDNFIDFIFEKEGKLQLMNRFEYTSSYDILYYILNIVKQFQVSSTDISILLYNLEDEETILLLKQYIGQVFNR